MSKLFPGKYSYVLFLAFALFLSLLYIQVFVPINTFPTEKTFEVVKNETGDEIFKNLETNGFIRSARVARIVSRTFGYKKFYPGEYTFEKPLSTYEIVYSVTKRPISYAVLIPEGFTKKQVADRIAATVKKFDKKDFLVKAKEGYLFPDTYYFYSYATVDDILKEFNDKFYKETFSKLTRIPTKDEVIVASILEREARDPEDMKIIAGIYANRLKIGMALQVDATVLYGKGAWKERTYYSDLLHDSDYNTYLNKGLPIGPISNPGLNSLKAAMYPGKNEYLYYLTGLDGKMYYAKTYDEHLKNKRKYLKR